jgi:ATP-dependent phosphoenolpyruvate carboxykinase
MVASNTNDLAANSVLRLNDVKVMHDKSYRLNLYLHQSAVNLSSLQSDARSKYLMRMVTLWQAHHDVVVEVFIRPTPEQLTHLRQGWVVTVQSEAVASSGDPAVHDSHLQMAAPAPLQATSKLFGALELQER